MKIQIDYQDRDRLQSFQLSNLLHHLTNTISHSLKENENTIYYDIRTSVPRSIIADYESLKMTLEEIMIFFSSHYSNGEVILSLTRDDKGLTFSIFYTSVVIRNDQMVSFPRISYATVYNDLVFSQTDLGGLKCEFSIPFYRDEKEEHYTNALQDILQHKKVLFVGKNKHELKIIHYIFQTYGMDIDFMTPLEFKEKKPNLAFYDIALLRSADLTPLQISIFKNLDQKNHHTKIIVMHDIFVSREERLQAKSIAYAEIFRPAIIGDVEEILRKIFIDGIVINDACCNEGIQKLQTFSIPEMTLFDKSSFEKFVGKNILLVDSSRMQLNIVKNILDIEGLNILTATDGKEALKTLENQKIDLIFTEINLAELDGCTLAKKLKKESLYANIPIVAVSSLSFDHELMKMIDHGIIGHIPVPFKKDHFYNALHRTLIQSNG